MSPELEKLQKDYVERAFGSFLHFSVGTFTDEEWAKPKRTDVATIFNPAELDTDQWADAAASAGMKYSVLTTKHHDGFALWETDIDALKPYSVLATEWHKKEKAAGRSGDIVKRYVESCRSRGIAPGFYFSIWDRTLDLSLKKTTDKRWATDFVKAQLTELLTKYGEIACIWTDGWLWFDLKEPGPVGYELVDYQEVYDHIKKLSPRTLLVENNHERNLQHSDIVGFERNVISMPPHSNQLPSEVCDTIRADNRWFYHPGDDDVKSVDFIVESLKACKERNTAYLLDLTPDRRGLIPESQVNRLKEVGKALEARGGVAKL
ncbi:glycoside hydrolase superfamily [Hyaloraphidium curvatum]|nr:glycoside hydrolase superfamily [Hyaloraphidium curvatum]